MSIQTTKWYYAGLRLLSMAKVLSNTNLALHCAPKEADGDTLRMIETLIPVTPSPSVLVVDVQFESRLWGRLHCFVSETFLLGNADLIVWCFGPFGVCNETSPLGPLEPSLKTRTEFSIQPNRPTEWIH